MLGVVVLELLQVRRVEGLVVLQRHGRANGGQNDCSVNYRTIVLVSSGGLVYMTNPMERPELQITDGMVRAATSVLLESGLVEFEAPGADELVVREMLEAALAQRLNGTDACGREFSPKKREAPLIASR